MTAAIRESHAGQAGVIGRIDGRELLNPPLIAPAEALHLTTYSGGTDYDVVVVGGGPAGLTAAINHAGLFGHKVLIVENETPGSTAGPPSTSSTTTSASPTASPPVSWPNEGFARR